MTNNISFEYAILHYRHDISTGEVLNIGLVLYAKENSYFVGKITTKFQRISKAFPNADLHFLRTYLSKIQYKLTSQSKKIDKSSNQFSSFQPNGIKGILSEVIQYDDSSIFFGEPKIGVLPFDQIHNYFEQLYFKMVDQYQTKYDRDSRSDEEIWTHFKKEMVNHSYVNHLQSHIIKTKYSDIKFDHGWKNGRLNILQPISFDLMNAVNIKKKSHEWLGTLTLLNTTNALNNFYFLVGGPKHRSSEVVKAYETSIQILKEADTEYDVEVIDEKDAEYFAKSIKPVIDKDLNL